MAGAIRRREAEVVTLEGEQLVEDLCMRGWRSVTGVQSVTVTLERLDVKVAKGHQPTLFNGDQVTIY